MNLEYVSVENSKYYREYFSPNSTRTEIDQHDSVVKNPILIECDVWKEGTYFKISIQKRSRISHGNNL